MTGRPDDERLDAELRAEIRRLEERAMPDERWARVLGEDLVTRRRATAWPARALVAAVAVAAVGVGAALALGPLQRSPEVGDASPSPTVTATELPASATPSPTDAAPSASPTPSPSPSATPTPTPAFSAPPAAWRSLPSLPAESYGRTLAGAVGPDGRFWVVGAGSDQVEIETGAALRIFDPATDTWELREGLSFDADPQAAFGADGRLWAFSSDGETLVAAPYDPVRDSWGQAAVHSPFADPQVASRDGVIHVTGRGRSGPVMLRFDATSRTFSMLSAPRSQLTALGDAGGWLVGVDSEGVPWRYEIATDTWSEGAASGAARAGGRVIGLEPGRVALVGGRGPVGLEASALLYDVVTDRWAALPDLPTPREGPAAAWVPGLGLVVAGGVGEVDRPRPCTGGTCTTPLLVEVELLEFLP